MIREDTVSSRSLSRVSRNADWCWYKLLLMADEFGRLDGRLEVVRAACFPTRPDVTLGEIERWLVELATCDGDGLGPLLRYSVGGWPYLQLATWEKHRAKRNRAETSRFPDPPQLSAEFSGEKRKESENVVSGSGGLGVKGSSGGVCDTELSGSSEQSEQAAESGADLLGADRKLLNLLSRRDGSPREKELWLADQLDVMKVEADGDGKKLRSLVVRWYRAYMGRERNARGERRYQESERVEIERRAAAQWHARQPPRPTAADPPEQSEFDCSLFATAPTKEDLIGRPAGSRRGDRSSNGRDDEARSAGGGERGGAEDVP